MIGYLEGSLIPVSEDRVIVLAGSVGYEVMLPRFVAARLADAVCGDHVALFIYCHQTERQPKPVLIGFSTLEERDFFERFIGVGDIGPIKATSALALPISEVAAAIENKDTAALQKMKGIGARTAMKIVAALSGKMGRFAGELPASAGPGGPAPEPEADYQVQVVSVLTRQLGHTVAEARDLIRAAMRRRQEICSPEELFEEIYRKQPA